MALSVNAGITLALGTAKGSNAPAGGTSSELPAGIGVKPLGATPGHTKVRNPTAKFSPAPAPTLPSPAPQHTQAARPS